MEIPHAFDHLGWLLYLSEETLNCLWDYYWDHEYRRVKRMIEAGEI